MKALSLWQPWASFIAIGIKPFETRSWAPPAKLIGQRVAIHAAKKAVPSDDRDWAIRCGVPVIPLGAVVCTAVLAGAYQCGPTRDGCAALLNVTWGSQTALVHAGVPVDEFGDYASGRWAWLLTNIEEFDVPIPATGHQGLWDWHDDAMKAGVR